MNSRVKRISPRTYKRSKKIENEVIQVPNGKKMVENARSNLFMMVLGGVGGLILASVPEKVFEERDRFLKGLNS